MHRRAKIFWNNRSQAVRLPKDFQFQTDEVFIRKDGDDVILSPKPKTWDWYFANRTLASEDFMEGVDDPPPQERDWWRDKS
jgi:antitoxin VapB